MNNSSNSSNSSNSNPNILNLHYHAIHSFYHTSNLYQNLDSDDDSLISIPSDKYWVPPEGSTIEENCKLFQTIDAFLHLLSICDYWGWKNLPLLVLKSYELLMKSNSLDMIYQKIKETNQLGELYALKIIETLQLLNDKRLGVIRAIQTSNLHIFQYLFDDLLANNVSIHDIQHNGDNLLFLACIHQQVAIVQYLFEHLIEPFYSLQNTNHHMNQNLVMIAMLSGNVEMVKYLYQQSICLKYFDVNLVDNNGNNFFLLACISGSVSLIQYLLEHNIYPINQINVQNNNDDNVFTLLCEFNHIHLLHYFMNESNGYISFFPTNTTLENNNGFNVFLLTCYHGCLETLQYLFDTFSYPYQEARNNSKEPFMMIYACEKNHVSIVQYLLQQPKYLHQDNHWDQAGFINNYNIVMKVCSLGSLSLLQTIIENTSRPFTRIHDKTTEGDDVLTIACSRGDEKIVQYLIENTVCPFTGIHSVDKNGNTILMLAIQQNNLSIIQYLIENTICSFTNIHAKDNNGNNVLMLACIHNISLSIIQYLLENTFAPFQDIHTTNNQGDNVLMIAAANSSLPILQYLVENRICPFTDIHAKNNNGNNVLTHCNSIDKIQYLIENTICPFTDIHAINKKGRSILINSICFYDMKSTKYVIENHICSFSDVNLLKLAAKQYQSGSSELYEYLNQIITQLSPEY